MDVRTIVKRDQVRLAAPGATPAGDPEPRPAMPARGRCARSVQLVRVGDDVPALEVRCACGEVTVVELEYEEDPK